MNSLDTIRKTARAARIAGGPVALMFVMLFAAAAPAGAQSDRTAKFEAPFAFVVGDTTLPAGTYAVEAVNQSVVRVRRVDAGGNETALCATVAERGKTAARETTVWFARRGDALHLDEIRSAGDFVGRRMPSKGGNADALAKRVAVANGKVVAD